MSEQQNNLEEILNLLSSLNNSAGFDVFIPSLKRTVRFKQLNTEQLKRLLKTNIDEIPIYNTEFILLLNTFIKENCLDAEIDSNSFTILDKFLILFKTRIESISPDYEFILTTKEKEKYNTKQDSVIYSLETNYDNFLKQQINILPKIYQNNNYSVTITLPTIGIESKFEEEYHKNNNIQIKNKEDLQNILTNTFVNEVAKYIQILQIDKKTIDLNELDFNSRIAVVEQLPAAITNETIKYIDYYKSITNFITTCDLILDNKARVTKKVPIDASFFSV